jgi:hypothetical protein
MPRNAGRKCVVDLNRIPCDGAAKGCLDGALEEWTIGRG